MNSRHSPIPSHTSVVSGIGRYSSTNQTSSPYCIVFTVRPIKHLCCSFVCKDVQPIKHVHSLPPLLPQSNCPRWLLITLTRQVCHCQPFFFRKIPIASVQRYRTKSCQTHISPPLLENLAMSSFVSKNYCGWHCRPWSIFPAPATWLGVVRNQQIIKNHIHMMKKRK